MSPTFIYFSFMFHLLLSVASQMLIHRNVCCPSCFSNRSLQFDVMFCFSTLFRFRTTSYLPLLLSNQYLESSASFEPTSVSLTKPRRNKRTFRSLLFHVNGPGTRCSLFSRIFSTFPETTLLASAFGGLRESHPLSLHPRARFFLKKKKKKVCKSCRA